ncbi:MAG TPA: coenzyme F420-0:L-glutamate ligase, partial [Candidatus Binatia bacterium]|nr:coenzyme F420-0:L-glutamate ligase [Candidatus Binatia bacterium]
MEISRRPAISNLLISNLQELMPLVLTPIPNLPHFQPGDDLAGILLHALQDAGMILQEGDVLALAQKIVSKVEGRFVRLADVQPGERALELASETGKDPR